MRQRSPRFSTKPLRPSEMVPEDFGPAWISLQQALETLTALDDGDAALCLMCDAIGTGKLTVFTSGVWRAGSDDDFDIIVLNRREAVSKSWAIPSLAGPIAKSFGLSFEFWKIGDISAAMTAWRGSPDGLVVAEVETEASPPGREITWEIDEPTISVFQWELVLRSIALGEYKPSKPKNSGGRPRTQRWDDWTAQLVEHVHCDGIAPNHDPSDLAALLEKRLQKRGRESVDRTSARMTLETVIKHSGTYVRSTKA